MKKIFFAKLTSIILLCTLCVCAKDVNPSIYKYDPPQQIDDGLEVSTLDSVGIDPGPIEYMIDDINADKFGVIHSVLIIKDGKLVLEEYFNGYNKYRLHELASVSKSFCSALAGIAIDKQFIESVNTPVKTYLPEYNTMDWTGKETITIHHLLTMSSGLEWDEWSTRYDDPDNFLINMINSPDPVQYVLSRPLVSEPGTSFTYNTGLPVVLGRILSNAAAMDLDSFAVSYLFNPLGIGNHQWYIYGNETYSIGSSLRLTSRDMAKFGLLYLNEGRWNGQQIVPEEWVRQSVQNYFTLWDDTYYGYYWWRTPIRLSNGQRIEGYNAYGRGGQFIFVLPTFDMVVVFTSWNDNELIDQPVTILQDYILPALN